MRYEDVVLADGPVIYWPATDTSGTTCTALAGSNGTWAGTPNVGAHPFPAGGRIPALDGSNDCSQLASLNLTAYSSIVLEFWWLPTTYGSLQMLMETSADFGANSGSVAVYLESTSAITIGTTQAGNNRIGKITPPALGKLHHFALQCNRGAAPDTWMAVVDGRVVPVTNNTNTGSAGNFATLALNVGARNNGASFPTTGPFGHAAIYSSLSVARAQAHYRAGLARPTRLPFRTRAA